MPVYKSEILTVFKLQRWIKFLILYYEFLKHCSLFFMMYFFLFFEMLKKALLLGHRMGIVISCCFVLGKLNLTQNCFRNLQSSDILRVL